MTSFFTDDELLAFLDEQLPASRAARLETELRASIELTQRLAALIRRRDHGGHSLGEIWRQARLSCPTRDVLRSYRLELLDAALTDYVQFHLETVECRFCNATLQEFDAIRTEQSGQPESTRRRRYFESSAGLLDSQSSPPGKSHGRHDS